MIWFLSSRRALSLTSRSPEVRRRRMLLPTVVPAAEAVVVGMVVNGGELQEVEVVAL